MHIKMTLPWIIATMFELSIPMLIAWRKPQKEEVVKMSKIQIILFWGSHIFLSRRISLFLIGTIVSAVIWVEELKLALKKPN